ncbi:tRNA lysidine(34) synthetase TilS [Candidatus Magnetaquicoccus inordinatus]|uniref:tRNA lysidine(34) synthetase TilS n=1 Tax=Candidatus Magnetaquicoccus inordinatus TaxID=2496818 RepID=UPI00187D23CD|nr:tRNA lysidine(34) synthetase TilS [Candidatus Magnetaquicoccus inordinatus]
MRENSGLLQRFRQHALPLLAHRQPILVAVSGGADSLALLHLLVASVADPHLSLHVAHFNHGLRNDAALDAQFVQERAAQLHLSCTVGCWQDRPLTGNLAEQARSARYQFLLATARQSAAFCVTTGHHQDDQAETILERLLRGSGVHGLQAISSSRPLAEEVALIRPLLPFSRAELRNWLQERGITWREDASNALLVARRNRIRHEVMPVLQSVADPALSSRLAATATRMQQTEQALQWMLEQLWPTWEPRQLATGGISLAIAPLCALPEELLYRCLQRCRQQLPEKGMPLGARAVNGFVQRLHSRKRHWSMVVQGMVIERQQDRLLFRLPTGRWN